MKKTIKHQALEFIAQNPCKRSALVDRILEANGSKVTDKRGYYCTNFLTWEHEGLISRAGGVYAITPQGMQYLKDPNTLKAAKAKKRAEDTKRSLEYYQGKARYFFRIIEQAERLAADLNWDADRMSHSGFHTLVQLQKTLKAYQSNY